MEVGPAFIAEVLVERYTTEPRDGELAGNTGWGPAVKVGGGLGFVFETDDPEIGLLFSGVGSGGYNTNFKKDGFTNGFGSLGVRASLLMEPYGAGIAAEAGYRVNSNGIDHPYLGAEASLNCFYIGPVFGVTVNPMNFARDEGPLFKEGSSFYFGVKGEI